MIKKVDALLEVKKTELEVVKLREDALRKKEEIIRDSKRDALRILDDAKAKSQAIYRGYIENAQSEIDETKKRIIGEGVQRAKELKAKADANRDNAVNLLVKKFENEVGNVKT